MENGKNAALVRTGSSALMKNPEEPDRIVIPAADIFETPDAFIIKVDMPGVEKESISVMVDRSRLVLRGSVKSVRQEQSQVIYSEIGNKMFQREFNLGSGLLLDEVDAQVQNGVLTITLPKAEEAKARVIPLR